MSSSSTRSSSEPDSLSVSRIRIDATLAERIGNAKGQLAIRVIDDMYKDPFWMERFAARGRRHSEEDLGFHVDYVVQAIIARDHGVMERYARWLQNVLTTRGMCSAHLAESFTRLDAEIRKTLSDVDAATVATYFEAANKALLYPSGTAARAVQDVSPPAISGNDFGYLASYLADALALDRPPAFVAHVTWLKEHGRSAEKIDAALTQLGRLIEGQVAAIDLIKRAQG